MKLNATDFKKLKFSVLATVIMVCIGVSAVYSALNAAREAKTNQKNAQMDRNDFDGKLKRVRSEEDEIKEKSAMFDTLRIRGLIGEEQRLEWIELLKDIRDKWRLIDLQYEIAPQQHIDANINRGFAFYTSTMKVQLKLLHEEDLTRLLDDLRQHAKALIQVKSCNISRLSGGNAERAMSARLQAECQIDWITLRATASK